MIPDLPSRGQPRRLLQGQEGAGGMSISRLSLRIQEQSERIKELEADKYRLATDKYRLERELAEARVMLKRLATPFATSRELLVIRDAARAYLATPDGGSG